MDLSVKRREAVIALKEGNYELALKLSLETAQFLDPAGCCICGMIYETGFGDLVKAYHYFDLSRRAGGLPDACNGCVRIILKCHQKEKRLLAIRLCREAIKNGRDGLSYLLLGRVLEELFDPPNTRLAKYMYLKAAQHRAAWGMRKFAALEYNRGSKVLGMIYHILVTPLFPLYGLLFGERTYRAG